MPDQDTTNVPELEAEGVDKETATVEEQAAELKDAEHIADDKKEGEGDTVGDKKADEEKPPTVEEHKAVMAELKRVRKLSSEKSDKVHEVSERLAKMEGKIEAGGGEQTPKQKLAKYSDRELVGLQLQWEDQRDLARSGDDAAALTKSKSNIEAIRLELHERSTTTAAKVSEEKADHDAILSEATDLIKEAVDAWPDLANEDSEIFKAARKEFESKPRVYRQLGVFADVVAAATAVAKNPKLVGTGEAKAVRKEVVKELTKAAEKAVHSGGGSTGVKTSLNVDAMTTDDVEAMAERIKAGGSLTK